MKSIDKNFNEIDKSLKVEEVIGYIKSNLKNMNIDSTILEYTLSNFDNLLMQATDDDSYSIKLPNSTLKENKILSNVGALKANMQVSVDSKELNIIPGIVMRKNYSVHQLIHEIFHGISSRQHNYFDENGITYTKTGTKINYYDSTLNDYEKIDNLSSDGLNEGITELLTSILLNEYNGNYAQFVVISYLFMNSNNLLLNAYFMNDISGMEKFYKDVSEKQSLITREDFINLDSKCFDFEMIAKIIIAGIEYNKSYGKEITNEELNFLINYLDNYLILDSGSWHDLIASFTK